MMYRCTVCQELFYSLVDCQKHVEAHHAEAQGEVCIPVRYTCGYCGRRFGHRADVQNHALRDHGLQHVAIQEEAI